MLAKVVTFIALLAIVLPGIAKAEEPLRMRYEPISISAEGGWPGWGWLDVKGEIDNFRQLREVSKNMNRYLEAAILFNSAYMYRDGVRRRDELAKYVTQYGRDFDEAQKFKRNGFLAKENAAASFEGEQHFNFFACKGDECTPISPSIAMFMPPIQFQRFDWSKVKPCCECPPDSWACPISNQVSGALAGAFVDVAQPPPATPDLEDPRVFFATIER